MENGKALYEFVAYKVVNSWNKYGNIIVESGATYLKQLKKVREIVGEDMPILTAGVGKQGASVENLKGLFGKNNKRLIVNSSRDIIFADIRRKNYFEEVKKNARELQDKLFHISSM